ncbi:MAG TPA: hypothetical protein PKY35_10475 [Candidatus Hydrogenedentes bacterium]|nr:hypothetical protein [Candidatus Hydrogenedentota bacterium]HOL77446.1 hypothetical protein [Candidatus Hydrogenedentota bacterium]HPO86573.1 hypothetical protein [Candidatus Hydrogenedentota bacterium]
MHPEDRPIHFSTELFYPPFQVKIPVLQKLYYELSQTPGASYQSADFAMPGPPRFFSRRSGNTQSIVLFLPDRLVVVEEWVDIPLESFLKKVLEVARRTFDAFELTAFVAQTVTLRTVFSLSDFQDARAFMLEQICGLTEEKLSSFGRPIGVGGMRFVFPPTPEDPEELHLLVESFRHNVHELFVEVQAFLANVEINGKSLERIVDNIRRVRAFIDGRVRSFLEPYDHKSAQ